MLKVEEHEENDEGLAKPLNDSTFATAKTGGKEMAPKTDWHRKFKLSGRCTGAQFEITRYFSLAVMGLRDCPTAVFGKVPACWVLYISGL